MGWRASSVVAAAFVAVVVAACGNTSPALLTDPPHDAAAPNDAPLFQETAPPTCNAGPDLGVCACTELNLLTDAPNLYLVLDRSGSMADNDKWTTIRLVLAQVMKSLGPRANFGVATFPKDSTDACAPGTQVMSMRPGDSPAGTQGPTTTTMLQVTSAPPLGGTPTAATLTQLLPTLNALHGRTFVILATDGGPNCNPSAVCAASNCITNIEGFCDTGNCCDPSEGGDPENCEDAQPTLDAVQAITAAGIPTYVVGVPGSSFYAGLLDDLAIAGGTARTSEPLYYAVDTVDQTALQTALAQIAAKITATCTFSLSEPPPDPTHVNVYFDNVAIPQDPTNGWVLSGSTVTLVGSSCDKVLAGDVLNVRVVAGCPTLQPN